MEKTPQQQTHASGQAAFINDDKEAELNANFELDICIDTKQMLWEDSPMEGVFRKRLELIDKSLNRDLPWLTTIVRFAANSYFKRHSHDGGEEFLVLAGVFSDESGDYAQGNYVRNPPQSSHQPFTQNGCTILVKLRQFQTDDEAQFAIDGQNTELWQDSSWPAIRELCLHQFQDEKASLYEFSQDDARLTLSAHKSLSKGCYEIYVIQGQVNINQSSYSDGYWLRFPLTQALSIQGSLGSQIWLKVSPWF